MKRKTVFLDRDGTIVVQRHYLADPSDVMLEAGVGQALVRLVLAGFRLIVVSNQSGVGRGYFESTALSAVTGRLRDLLEFEGVQIAGWYYCPHAPSDNCACRKPGVGLLRQADQDFPVDWATSFLIGDSRSDAEAAAAAGVTPVLLGTGQGIGLAGWASSAVMTWVPDMTAAADLIIGRDAQHSMQKGG
jgi:D-glycero-D-manno-heptose 1,7-bisphosphate phosphatase